MGCAHDLPLGLTLALFEPNRILLVVLEDPPGGVGIAVNDAFDGETQKGALFKREGIAFTQVLDGPA